MKKFSIIILILIILSALVYYFFPLERIVKKVVNKYGSEVTATNVDLQGFKTNLQKGKISIKQISVANPSNYKTKYAIQLGNIDVSVDLNSLTSDTIIINEILVNKPVISYEMKSLTENNISEIIKNVTQYSSASSTKQEDAKETKKDQSEKKVIIKKVIIQNGEINGAVTAAPDIISAAVPLPTLTLNDIGQSSNGTSIADSIAFIFNKLLSSVSTTVISSNLANLKDVAKTSVSATKETIDNTVDNVKGSIKDTIGIFSK